jgi:hypothetical protein
VKTPTSKEPQRTIEGIVGKMIFEVTVSNTLPLHIFDFYSLGWQDTARWNQMISSLVMPQTPTPDILQIHRRNVTLSWEAVYYPTSQDKTRYGVNITICSAEIVLSSQRKGLLSSSSSLEDEKVSNCFVILKEKSDLIQVNKFSENSEDYIPQIVSTHVQGLQPSVNYKIRLTTFYGDIGSLPSQFTSTISTLPDIVPSPPQPPFRITPATDVATSVLISFERPIDDGGKMILGYHVFTRNTHRHHHKHWVWNGVYGDSSKSSSSVLKLSFEPFSWLISHFVLS